MLRNREVQYYFLSLCFISGIALIAAILLLSTGAVVLVAVLSIVFITAAYLFTKWRYQEIERLSHYLQEISNGNFQLDLRDNTEGELSLLKSQIYKVTKKLSEQGTFLAEDKTKLTDAISDISHQLKTPLTSMTVMADLLRDARLTDEKREEFTRNIQLQLERMEWLVSSLLKLSKIDAGTIVFKREEVSVRRLIQAAVEPMLVPIDIKMQELHIEGADETSFQGDFNWSAEALINVIKNCVEHTPEQGKITVRFSENVLYTEILISDTGNGIAKEDLPYIFQRFYKGKNGSEDSVGIGLAMAHSIITSQQGDLSVKSQVGEGTTFQIRFYKTVI